MVFWIISFKCHFMFLLALLVMRDSFEKSIFSWNAAVVLHWQFVKFYFLFFPLTQSCLFTVSSQLAHSQLMEKGSGLCRAERRTISHCAAFIVQAWRSLNEAMSNCVALSETLSSWCHMHSNLSPTAPQH